MDWFQWIGRISKHTLIHQFEWENSCHFNFHLFSHSCLLEKNKKKLSNLQNIWTIFLCRQSMFDISWLQIWKKNVFKATDFYSGQQMVHLFWSPQIWNNIINRKAFTEATKPCTRNCKWQRISLLVSGCICHSITHMEGLVIFLLSWSFLHLVWSSNFLCRFLFISSSIYISVLQIQVIRCVHHIC